MTYLFGFEIVDIKVAAPSVASALGVKPELRESSFRGGPYWAYQKGAAEAILQYNNDGGPGDEPAEDRFAGFRVLLYVYGDNNSEICEELRNAPIPPTFLRCSRY